MLITFIALEKCKNECGMALNILVQSFYPLKMRITWFPDRFHFNNIKKLWQLKYYHVALHNLLSYFFFQADCLEEGEADVHVFMSVFNRIEATEVKDIIATGKRLQVPRLVCA